MVAGARETRCALFREGGIEARAELLRAGPQMRSRPGARVPIPLGRGGHAERAAREGRIGLDHHRPVAREQRPEPAVERPQRDPRQVRAQKLAPQGERRLAALARPQRPEQTMGAGEAIAATQERIEIPRAEAVHEMRAPRPARSRRIEGSGEARSRARGDRNEEGIVGGEAGEKGAERPDAARAGVSFRQTDGGVEAEKRARRGEKAADRRGIREEQAPAAALGLGDDERARGGRARPVGVGDEACPRLHRSEAATRLGPPVPAISRTSLASTARRKSSKSLATTMNEPGPPITQRS